MIVISWKLRFLLLVLMFNTAGSFKNYTDVKDVMSLVENSPTNQRIIKIGNDLLKAKSEIDLLNTSIEKISNMTVCQKLFAIGRVLMALQVKIADQKITKRHAIYQMSIIHLTSFYNFLYGQMIEIRKNIIGFEQNCSQSSVVKAINNRQFKKAEDILKLIQNEWNISWIVHEIYDSNANNMGILLSFTESLSTIGVSISMINAIYKELEEHGHLDLFQMLGLLRFLDSDIFNETNFDLNQHRNVLDLHKKIVNFLKKNSSDMMVAEMLNHTFESSEKSPFFVSELYNVNKKLLTDIIFEVFDRVYGKIPNNEIIDNIFIQFDSPVVLESYVYMYKKMKSLHHLDTGILKLTQYIFYILKIEYNKGGFVSKPHEELKSIWHELPHSIKNLYSAESVRLKNVKTSEYLCPAADHFSHDVHRRNISTWIPGYEIPKDVWYIHKKLGSENFNFVNKEYLNEYMYASGDGIGGKCMNKHVYIGKLKGHVDSTLSAWNVEAVGKYIRMINVSNNQILCVTSNTYDEDKRYVMTLPKDIYELKEICLWDVEAFKFKINED